MTRVLRGAWSRRGTLGSLVAMTAVVVAGTVTVIGFARAAGTSMLLAAPLLLLGAVAVPAIGRELAAERREEVGLARLRGIRGPRLVAVLLAEPLLAVVAGTVLGLAAGAAGTWLATRWWLDQAASPLSGRAALVALAVALGSLAVVMLGYAASLREPLALQVSTASRPRRATTLAVFGTVLAVAAAAVAVYRSRVETESGPDLVVLLGPALLGLAVGQAAVWVLRALARLATARTGGRGGLAGFLAARRVARADDLVGPLRLVVAAAVVGALALSGSQAVAGWSETQARVDVAGPRTVAVDGGPVRALELTRRLDPEGRWLMATTLVPGDASLSGRRAFVETTRYGAVVGDFLEDTPAAPGSGDIAALAPDSATPIATGDRLVIEARSLTGSTSVRAEVTYINDESVKAVAAAGLEPSGATTASASVPVPDCARACLPTGLTLSPGGPGPDAFELPEPYDDRILLTEISFAGADLLDLAWVPGDNTANGFVPPQFRDEAKGRLLVNRPDGLEVRPLTWVPTALVPETPRATPVLVTAGGSPTEGFGTVGGDDRRAVAVATRDALPLVGRVGALGDLTRAVAGSAPAVPGSVVTVVAAEDTPADVLGSLEQAAGEAARTVDEVRADLVEASGGEQATAYALMAAASLLVALLAMVAGAGRHRRAYIRDVAALRSAGVGASVARRAGRTELLALAGVVVAAVVLGGWSATSLLLPGLPLVDVPATGLPLDTGTRWPALLVTGLLAGAAVMLLGGRARAVSPAATRPAILREEVA